MATQELITLFLASPGDVNAERAVVRKVVEEYNDSIGKARGVRVEVNGWETHARPAWGKDRQAIINGQIADMKNHALFVGILWNRFGTPTPRAASGTREEYDLALAARRATRGKRPEVMFYFGAGPLDAHSQADLDQKGAVLKFKAEIEKKRSGLYWTFKNTADFEALFRKHYAKWLNDYIAARPIKTRAVTAKTAVKTPGKIPTTTVSKPKPAPRKTLVAAKIPLLAPKISAPKTPAPKLILLDGEVYRVEDVREIGANWTMTLRPQTPAEDKRIRELLNKHPRNQFGGFALTYKLQSGSASVNKTGERGDDEKGDYWKLDLNFTEAPRGHAINYQNMSADQVAQQRARWILLAQEPAIAAPRHPWESPNNYLIQQIKGQSEPILPALWKRVKGDRARFKAMAELIAVESLLKGEVCESIEELKIGAVTRGKASVKFRGTRSDGMGKPIEFSATGTCLLPAIK